MWCPRLSPKGLLVFNCTTPVFLVSGPRLSGKSWSVEHKVVRHLWETPGARAAIFAKTIKSAKDGGVWDDIVNYTIPEWVEANLEGVTPDVVFGYTQEPKIDGHTRTSVLRIRNYWGSESELKLFSLDFDGEVEAKVKGTRFSLFWFSELTNFQDRKVLITTKQQLRMPHLRLDQHQWIADTNPAEDGPECCWHDVFYKERTMEGFPEWADTPDKQKEFRTWQGQLGLIEIFLDDNPFISEQKKNEVKSDFAYDPDMYDRYVNGKWVNSGGKDRFFHDIFKPNIHVIGDTSSAAEENWEIMLPSEGCFELLTGWDTGETNHSAHILEKIQVEDVTYWHVLDELVSLHTNVSLVEFTRLLMDKMRNMEKLAGRKIMWRHYSDDSASRYRAVVDDIDRNVVYRTSGGTIELEGVPKPDGSVMDRVHMVRRLLFEERLKISAHCHYTIQMIKRLRRDRRRTRLQGDNVQKDDHKHPFDSLTYPIIMESAYDVAMPNRERTGTKRDGMISIAL